MWRLGAAAVGGLLAGCGASSVAPTPTAAPTPPPRPLAACSAASLSEPGFVPDTAHSGTLTTGRYSLNGDVQAALLVFGFDTGVRQVFSTVAARPLPTASAPGTEAPPDDEPTPTPTPTPAPPLTTAPPGTGPDLLVVCDVLRFGQADGGRKFVQAFRQLRLDNHQQEVAAPHLGDRSVAFMDHDQAFAGYTIDNANGAEIAVGRGSMFWSVSVFGPHPALDTALTILRSMMSAAG
jgi:hypothetical protein